MKTRAQIIHRRKTRIRQRIRQASTVRARLTIHRTNLHIYAQLIDDRQAITLASASSVMPTFKKEAALKNGGNKAAARIVGQMIAKAALAKGVKDVVFDRSGLLYHGRVQALADAARETGLNF